MRSQITSYDDSNNVCISYKSFLCLSAEAELMKERFAKLLLGEDMSGGGKGVSTALAISNAITNLAGSCISRSQ